MPDYTNAAQQRVLSILDALTGHELDGLTLTQIALITNSTLTQVIRDLYNLEIKGFVERDGEKWRHGQKVMNMFRAYSASLNKSVERAAEGLLRVTRNER